MRDLECSPSAVEDHELIDHKRIRPNDAMGWAWLSVLLLQVRHCLKQSHATTEAAGRPMIRHERSEDLMKKKSGHYNRRE